MNYITHKNAVVLYWDLPDNYKAGDKLTVLLNGEEIGQTEKCHFKTQELNSDSEYKFEVLGLGEIVAKTEPEKNRIDISKPPYNATGDGKTLNTRAIQQAINDCKAGECVYIPEGDFMTGSLYLHSDMELYLEKGAILHGTTCVEDYTPKIKSRFEGIEMMCYAALLNVGELDRAKGVTCQNVKITGEGMICGGGRELSDNVIELEFELMKDELAKMGDEIKECETSWTIPGRARPRLVNISCAKNVEISGVTIAYGPCWNVHMIYSDNIVTYGCEFHSKNVHNGDGWDPDSSTNCTLFGSEFYTGDDSVAIKSGKNPEGNIINKPSEHIRVFDCISHSGHGITIGSEMSGGINDVKIWNCDVNNSMFGVEIKGTRKRGGYVRNVSVRNCEVGRIIFHSVPYNDDGEGSKVPPVFENCLFENIKISAVKQEDDGALTPCEAIEVAGFDEEGHFVKNVKFKNICLDNGKGSQRQAIYLQCCEGVSFENIYAR